MNRQVRQVRQEKKEFFESRTYAQVTENQTAEDTEDTERSLFAGFQRSELRWK